jgi:hypothetical protein
VLNRKQKVDRWTRENMNLRAGGRMVTKTNDYKAYESGRKAGKEFSLDDKVSDKSYRRKEIG